jgi:hypothetical protein
MSSQINDLVAMRDVETLVELMEENDDWMLQLDAAEGLVKLGDRRGLDFLLTACESDDEQVVEVVKEILSTPAAARMKEEMDAEQRRVREATIQKAKARLQKGRKVFRYKMVYLASGEFLNEMNDSDEFNLPALDEEGALGWEVIHVLPHRGNVVSESSDQMRGAYFLMRREISPDEAGELDSI